MAIITAFLEFLFLSCHPLSDGSVSSESIGTTAVSLKGISEAQVGTSKQHSTAKPHPYLVDDHRDNDHHDHDRGDHHDDDRHDHEEDNGWFDGDGDHHDHGSQHDHQH